MRKRSWTPLCPVSLDQPIGNPNAEAWKNHSHFVIACPLAGGMDGWVLLSIRRNDRAAERDWRTFQRIKNEVCGPEREAMELYPAQARLVDSSNQYHLWVAPEGMKFPIGYPHQDVMQPEDAAKMGAVQREFEEGDPSAELCKPLDPSHKMTQILVPTHEENK